MVLLMFFESLYFGHFLSFYTMQLEPPKSFLTPGFLSPRGELSLPDLLGGCARHAEAGQEPGSLCLALAFAEAKALGSLRVVPVRGPAMGLPLGGPCGFGLGLPALRWPACAELITDGSGFPYPPSFDGGLGWCIEGRRTPRLGPLRVCVYALFLAGSGGRAPQARFGAPQLSCGSFLLRFAGPPPGWGCPFPVLLFAFLFFFSFLSFSLCPRCLRPSLVSGPLT